VNGDLGMNAAFNPAEWKMKVARAPGDTLVLTMEDIKRLPKTEIVFDFKCIEGWDQITHWGGVKMQDFIKAYHLEGQTQKTYMGMRTPDGAYYVGIDMPSAIHPQTILAYEMNGQPLPFNQGAPLRLIIPLKYGIKHIKRIGIMFFSDTPPPDYWAEAGYDYYAGH
jgi:DMSO/TMAO reductase YedYZ molybdopterin-dependent catalytic subunit